MKALGLGTGFSEREEQPGGRIAGPGPGQMGMQESRGRTGGRWQPVGSRGLRGRFAALPVMSVAES